MNDQVETVKRASKEVNNVTMADGSVRDFGKKGQLQADITIGDAAIDIKVHLVTGRQYNVTLEESNPVFKAMAARGFKEYLSNSSAGVYSDSDGLHPEDFDLAIDTAIANIRNGVIPTRERLPAEAKGLADLISALTEARQSAKTPEGEPMFSEEESSKAFVTNLIVSSTPEENKVRRNRPAIKAIIDRINAERAAAKASKSAKVATIDVDDFI